MSNIFDGVGEIVKREMVLFFLIDQSGSMAGTKIGAVNTAIREAIPMLRDVGGSDAKIKIATLLFSSGCRWMYADTIAAEDFQWTPVEAFGVTDFGAALQELSKKMSKTAFLSSPSASVAPAIFLMSDGQPTDEYENGLKILKDNRWFKHAIRVAVAIGDDADINVLAEFTGNPEAVIRVHTPEALRKMIHFVTVTSSKIGSQSQPVSDDGSITTKQNDMIQNIQDYLDDNPDIDQNAADEWGKGWD
jgi:uncharacterized protein YegL